jgi:hypothetical protein
MKKNKERNMPEIFANTTVVSIDDLYLDPNNPRLGRPAPGYMNPELLFDNEIQKELISSLIAAKNPASQDNKEFGVDELIQTIMAKGWIENAEPVWVWSHPQVEGKYVVMEGNRRCTAIKTIIGDRKTKWLEKLSAAEKAQNAFRENEALEVLKKIAQIETAARSLEVKPLLARSEQELKQDLTVLLSVRHITGARPWSKDAADIWLLSRYKDMHSYMRPEVTGYEWDKDLIDDLAREASIKPKDCKDRLKAISWYEDFKVRYDSSLPELDNGKRDTFVKKDYWLFKEIASKKNVRETIFKISDEDIYLPERSAEAIFKWVFEKPSHLDHSQNQNKFYAHRCVGYLSKMINWDNANSTSFSKGYDVDNPDDAPKMADIYDVDFRNAQQNAQQTNTLDRVADAMRKLASSEIYEGGESVIEQVKYIHQYAGQILATMEQNNG